MNSPVLMSKKELKHIINEQTKKFLQKKNMQLTFNLKMRSTQVKWDYFPLKQKQAILLILTII